MAPIVRAAASASLAVMDWPLRMSARGADKQERRARRVVARSCTHFDLAFSKDAREETEKQTRKTSVCGYARGRSRGVILLASGVPSMAP